MKRPHTPEFLTKYLSGTELRDLGILQEINRQLLHPRGLAAEIDILESGSIRIGDFRSDPKGMAFVQRKVDRFVDVVLAYRPKPKNRAAQKRKRKAKK